MTDVSVRISILTLEKMHDGSPARVLLSICRPQLTLSELYFLYKHTQFILYKHAQFILYKHTQFHPETNILNKDATYLCAEYFFGYPFFI